MEKKTSEELAEAMVEVTVEYTQEYFRVSKSDQMERKMWGAVHVGFCGALATLGYDKKTITRAFEIAQKGLEPFL